MVEDTVAAEGMGDAILEVEDTVAEEDMVVEADAMIRVAAAEGDMADVAAAADMMVAAVAEGGILEEVEDTVVAETMVVSISKIELSESEMNFSFLIHFIGNQNRRLLWWRRRLLWRWRRRRILNHIYLG